MISLLKKLVIPLLALFCIITPLATPAIAYADIQSSLCGAATTLKVDAGNVDCQKATSGSESHFQQILADIVNIFSLVVGVAAVIMIIVGGFRYITSGGNQEGVKSAKNTIIYAIVGLVIVALAQVIVKFVLNQAINPPSSSSVSSGQACDPTKADPAGYTCQCTHDESGNTCALVRK